MEHVDDPADMAPMERLGELASLLARAYLRGRGRQRTEADDSAHEPHLSAAPDLAPARLDFQAIQSVNDVPVDASREAERWG